MRSKRCILTQIWTGKCLYFVPAEDIVVPYGASSLETSERVTHVMRKTKNELRKLQVMGFYKDVELDDPTDTLDEIEKKIAEQMGFKGIAG
jgi:hypothetical protein